MERSNKEKLRIAIFAASSQVGSSIAFYLKHFTSHEPVCFIRSKYSAIFFEMAGITTISADINNGAVLKEHLKDVDGVLDFSFPSGQIFEIPALIEKNFEGIISNMPAGVPFFHMSSIMAYGMPSEEKNLRAYSLPRASYGYIKRNAEQKALAVGAKHGVPIFNYRLGQVHGFLQSVSESFREKLYAEPIAYLDGNPSDLTNTIFIPNLADAIINSVRGEMKPGLYTLVASPQWTLKELYDYYLDWYQLDTVLEFKPQAGGHQVPFVAKAFSQLKKYRPLIETYLLLKMPETSVKIKGRFRKSEIANQVSGESIKYVDFNLLGTPTTDVPKGINSSVENVKRVERGMQDLYLSMLRERVIKA